MRATTTLQIGAGLSTTPHGANAAVEAARAAKASVKADVDLAVVFLSPHHSEGATAAVHKLVEELSPRHLLGCVAQGVVGGAREIEAGPAVSVWAASLPGAEIETFHAVADLGEDEIELEGLPKLEDADLVALLADPFTFPAGAVLDLLGEDGVTAPIVGGLALGTGGPQAQVLIAEGDVVSAGAVGARVSGVPVRTVVSQGCSPLGADSVVTSADGNVVHELAGRPALERLGDELAALSPERRRLAAQGLLVGVVIDENRSEYVRGDYLIRGLIGADQDTGAIAIGERVRVGQTLRFHVRDAASADEDLVESLDAVRPPASAGALLFTCSGRGTSMFSAPNHDADAVTAALGTDAVAGMFCGGEIGPVGGTPFLHGFTATLAIFESR
jgi:small ligand-binding sensory domain FIST